MLDATTDYANAVVAGDIVAGSYIRAACVRHLRDLMEADKRGIKWDIDAAHDAIIFFPTFLTVQVELEGDDEFEGTQSISLPFELQPWQAFIVGSLFGWKRKNGFRRFRRAYIEIGKGNGKSPLAAGIGLYMFCASGKERAEVYSAATDMDQAFILFRDAVDMVQRSDYLSSRITESGVNPVWQLSHKKSGSFFKPIAAIKKGKSGIRPHCALADEIHEHPNDEVIEMLRAGTKGNRDALLLEITNSGSNKTTVCGVEHDYSVSVVLDDVKGDSWFAFICSLDEGDDPFEDESCWIKANPNLGVSIHHDYIREQVEEAKGMPSKEGRVRRLNFCQWTQAAVTIYPRHIWQACQATDFNPQYYHEQGFPCYGGLDLSRTKDLTALTLLWVLDATKDSQKFAAKTWFWTPLDTLEERSKTDKAPYQQWVDQGFLQGVDGSRINYRWFAPALAKICDTYNVLEVGCDDYGMGYLNENLDDLGIELPLTMHPQGFQVRVLDKEQLRETETAKSTLWMPDSINKTENAIVENRIIIENNPVMTMCAAGVVYQKNLIDQRMYAKPKATSRIDGMVSLSMSIGMATLREIPRESVSDWIERLEAYGS